VKQPWKFDSATALPNTDTTSVLNIVEAVYQQLLAERPIYSEVAE
jgi:hypothetical protein